MKVDAGRDILNDLVIGIAAGEVLALADEVGALLGAGDAAVDNPGAGGGGAGCCGSARFRGGGDVEDLLDVRQAVEALSGAGSDPQAADAAVVGP